MIDLTKCAVERLRADDTFILYRADPGGGARSQLVLVPRQPTLRSLEKLENEYALTADLDPAWAVLPVELIPHKDNMMLVLDDPGGEPLAGRIGSPLDLDARLRLAVGMAGCVARLHRQRLVHRDIKPGNFLVTERDGLRLTGFGNATHQTSQETAHDVAADVIAGTLPYISPEQTGRMNRPIDARSDLYSLGVTLYELFTGTLPFNASAPEEWIHCHVVRAPPAPSARMPDLPLQISAIVLKLLSKEPADRYQSGEGLAADLEECLAEWTARRRVHRFALGRYDAITTIRIPRTLYGRADDIAALHTVYDRVAASGQTVVALISGPSGVGKSSLAAEFQSHLAPEGALVATGKFDQQTRDTPYAALNQAFASLLRQILTYDDEEVAAWRQTLAEAIGPNGHLVTELIPAFELILGRQPPVEDLTPQDRLNRLRIVFRRLVGAFARPGRPLVLFVDDLQWLDVATVDLVGDLVTRRDVLNLMLIGAYRTNEVGPSHPLTLQLDTIRTAGVPVEEVVLDPLSSLDIAVLIAETLECGRAEARSLAKLVHAKTGGNAFFATQFLRTLNDEGLLAYDPRAGAWQWDIARVRAQGLTDSVADLMAAKLNLLSGSSRQVLLDLASLGSAAEVESLAVASGQSVQEVIASLRPALQAGLVARKGRSYAFVHDRVQEAAYGLAPAESRPALHLRIGMALAGQTAPDETSEKLYIVANQLNRGVSAVTNDVERQHIIAVNLAAGRRARSAAAYNAAIAYLEIAQQLLGDDAHPRCSERAFAIALLRAECEFLVGHLDVAEAHLLLLSQNCANLQASAAVARILSNLYSMQGQLARAVAVCLDVLRLIGIDWQPHPTDSEVDEEGRRLRMLSEQLSDDDLRALPPLTDPDHRTAMAVFADLVSPALLTDLNLSHLVIMGAARLTLQHGSCESACYPLVCVFSVFFNRYADPQFGVRLAQLGVWLAERQPQLGFSGRAIAVFGYYVIPWVQPIRSALPFVRRGRDIALATGDLAWVAYLSWMLTSIRLFCGNPLQEALNDAEGDVAFDQAAGFELPAANSATQRDLALSLIGHENDRSFEVPGPIDVYPRHEAWPQTACMHYVNRIQVNVLAGHHDAAVAFVARADQLYLRVRAYLELVEYRFYAALAHAAAHDAAPPERRELHVESIRQHWHELTIRCAHATENFAGRLTLLAAEIARIEGRELDAERLYEEAIRLAREADFVQIEAIAAERAARFYEARGIRTVVLSYLAIARDCYQRWGADAKVRQLERAHPHLPSSDARIPIAAADLPLQQLDVNALFKASRALSGEIELDTLIRTLMQVVIEQAAAERGILFLVGNDGPKIAAEAHLSARGVDVTMSEADHRHVQFPQPVLNYVVRTRTSLNSAEPANKALFSADPYLRQRRRVSFHCLPIVAQAKLVGVLYLESNVTVGAFTPQRTIVLDLLAAQAAISLENARLYADLQRSEAFLAEGQSISHTGSWSWNARTGRLIWSDEHYRIFGADPRSGKPPSVAAAFRMVHPEDRAALRSTVQASMRNDEVFDCEFRLVRPDGVRHLHIVGRPAPHEPGTLRSYIGTTIDLSDYRRAQEALQAAQSDLAHASRLTAFGELTSLIAHEVRQPLTAIAARAGACSAWLARNPPEIGKAAAAAARIAGYAHRASGVMESIRQMTRKSAPTRAPLDVIDAIRETAALLSSEIRRQRVVLRMDLAVGPHIVLGDRVQLQQVVMNLMMNGIEAMATTDDRPRFLSLGAALTSSGTVAVAVADVGIGLPAGETEHLYDAFFTTKPSGLGVGLSICRSIIKAHGGALWASPNHPHGSVFRFTLPIAHSDSRPS
ncbi:AAA family ATPase [Bradyrhizobium ivorense]|uniref:AAA family ATPase n=1 Tax=Bradyrhizobium ivorense TaxID=2511166 RepID=UPI0010BBFB6F|nr:AAA family ATPase [Bradyrhizobium ivorense]VIO67214.1 Sensor protein FixL [Bradyrhizobium ivorense]